MKLKHYHVEFSDLEEIWTTEKAALQGEKSIKEELEQARLELEAAGRSGDLNRMSELQYGRIPELETRLKTALKVDKTGMKLVRNEVTEEEVAEIVSKWTHIPVSRMLEGEREKLLRMERELHRRVVGQNKAVEAVSHAIRRSRSRIG